MNVQTGQTDFSDTLTGTAMIKSGSSAFSGNLGLSSNTKDNGLDGHFYGPNAAEIGATFYRASPGDVTTGAFFGARDATPPHRPVSREVAFSRSSRQGWLRA
jgi:hypothetical protein